MNLSPVNLLVAMAIVSMIVAVWFLRAGFKFRRDNWLPKELRNAELVYAEKLFRSGGDVPIVAKCDRAYRTKKGVIVLVELKTRKLNRVYQSDIIELSAQRYTIQLQSGQYVSPFAYVLVRQSANNYGTPHKVELMSSAELVRLAKRRQDILDGVATPKFPCSDSLCKKCSYADECGGRK